MASFLGALFGGEAEKEAAAQNRALYEDYLGKGTGYLNTALDASKGYLNRAVEGFAPLADIGKKYGAGTDLYLDALGVNGADGNARASGAFQAGPGYEFTLDQGIDAINRRRAAGGMLGSGNADVDAIKYATGLADTTYGNWLKNLSGLVSPELTATAGAASGQAGAFGSLANLSQLDAANRIGLLGNFTSGTASANNMEAAGEAKGAGNLLGFGMNLGKLAFGGF